MPLICLSFHHIKTQYANFQKVRFDDTSAFYLVSQEIEEIKERVLLQTGTRVEVYAIIDDIDTGIELLLKIFSSKSGLDKETLKEFFDIYTGEDAARHLFRLIGGIESRVLGETYIPIQVEAAFRNARENRVKKREHLDSYPSRFLAEPGSADSYMDTLFDTAIRVGRKARAETKIEGELPVADKAVKHILKKVPEIQNKNIVLFGAGLTGQKVAKSLRRRGPKYLTVINRNFDIGKIIAEKIGGSTVRYDDSDKILSKADILVCATLASHYRVTPDMLLDRKSPIVVVDVSPFGNVDPAVGRLPDVILINGNLRKDVEKNLNLAKAEIPEVEKIIKKEIDKLYQDHDINLLFD